MKLMEMDADSDDIENDKKLLMEYIEKNKNALKKDIV